MRALFALLSALCVLSPAAPVPVFSAGESGYAVFRIPALARDGPALIALAEGREAYQDLGDIDVVAKVSLDDGLTWGPLQVLCDVGPDTCGNPNIVVLGDIIVAVFNTQPVDGPVVRGTLGAQIVRSGTSLRVASLIELDERRGWDAAGPGSGLAHSSGVAVIPAIGRNWVTSDGVSWEAQPVGAGRGTNESSIVELSDGSLMRADRPSEPAYGGWQAAQYAKWVTRGQLGDRAVWTAYGADAELSAPGHRCASCPADALTCDQCVAACERVGLTEAECREKRGLMTQTALGRLDGGRIFYVSPASTRDRVGLRVKLSGDDGETWETCAQLDVCRTGYASATSLGGGRLGVLHEHVYKPAGCGRRTNLHDIVFRQFR